MSTQEADRPRIYLVAPATLGRDLLEAALDAGDVACLLLRDATPEARPLVQAAQARDVAVLVMDDPALAERLGADGVHLRPGGRVKAARRSLSADAIVGVQCGQSRHAAMLAGEAGADYVAFAGRDDAPQAAADPAILAWWQAMMELPCVAMGDIALGDVHALADAGADFVALEREVWEHPDGPGAAIAFANGRLAEVRRG